MRRRIVFSILLFTFVGAVYLSDIHGAKADSSAANECEGNACNQITLSWDDAKQQYRVQNNSTSRWVKVDAGNRSAGVSVCVGPGKSEYLPLESLVGKYYASYNEESCVRST